MRFSWTTFGIAWCLGYALAFALHLPLFLYYPMESVWAWQWRPFASAGPSMAWYGLMGSAAMVALPLALLLPDGAVRRRLRGWLWLPPVVALAVAAWLLRSFFLR